MLVGKYVSLRELILKDVYTFKNWSKHSSYLLLDYNFNEVEEKSIKDWFIWKTHSPFSKYYVILKDSYPIGYISFKNISYFLKSACLGIALNPTYINKGYGGDAIKTMLKYFFDELKFKKISLKVASYNKRALHLYEKIGFKKRWTILMSFPNGNFDINIKDFYNNKECFKKVFGKTFFYAYQMDIRREDFINGI